jgi:hypothetical protein
MLVHETRFLNVGGGPKNTKKKSCNASYVLKSFQIQKETNVAMFYGY